MDESTDPPARQLALTALTTEQFNLQSARMGTIAEADASVPAAAVTGAVATLVFATLLLAYQVRRFARAAAVVPELFEGKSPGVPGWTDHPG